MLRRWRDVGVADTRRAGALHQWVETARGPCWPSASHRTRAP